MIYREEKETIWMSRQRVEEAANLNVRGVDLGGPYKSKMSEEPQITRRAGIQDLRQ